jgi:DNA-binding XRE family transcriptional regulator
MPVYMIRSGEYGPVKIGHATDPYDRLAALQVAHFDPLVIIRLFDGSVNEERALHRAFMNLRVRGEWFSFCPSMMEDVGLIEVPIYQHKKGRLAHVSSEDLRDYAKKHGLFMMTAYREAHSLTQADLAATLGVTQSTVARWEAGSMPARDMLTKIAEITEGQVMPNDWIEPRVVA